MAKLITNSFRSFIIERLVSANGALYVALGKHTAFSNEASPPDPINSTDDTYILPYDTAIVAKAVKPYNTATPNNVTSDIQVMIPRVDWTSNTSYSAYRSSSANVGYVGVFGPTSYDVFKCLSNNDGLSQVRSQYAPDLGATNASDDIYNTADGYQWKYMYSVSPTVFAKFATESYVPVYHDASVRTNANAGGVEYIEVGYAGSHYNATTGGTIQAVNLGGNTYIHQIETVPGGSYAEASPNSGFYVGSAIKITSGAGAGEMRTIVSYTVSGAVRTIVLDSPFSTLSTSSQYEISPKVVMTGDGSGFVGRALINTQSTNTVYAIEVVQPGAGYKHATATVQGNTSGVSNSAQLSVVISPPGGHGYDPIDELGGKYLCLTSTFDSTDPTANGKVLDVNDFRNISVFRAPLLANVYLTLTNSIGVYTVGETVTQSGTGATGVVTARTSSTLTLTNVSGSFLPEPVAVGSQYTVTGATSLATSDVVAVYNNGSISLTANTDYVNMAHRLSISNLSGTFELDEKVIMYSSNTAVSNGNVYFANSSQIWLTNVQGSIPSGSGSVIIGNSSGAEANVSSSTPPDLLYGSGDVIYTENISPINRSTGQTETVKVIIEF